MAMQTDECMKTSNPWMPALMAWLMASLLPMPAYAQTAPVGRWKTIDDETGKAKSIVEIRRMDDGSLQGKVVQVLPSDDGPDPLCDKCDGANRDKPVRGMTILWGLREAGGRWAGGSILDPAQGRTYKAKLKVVDADTLGVAGCLAFICREQTWVRE